MSQDQSQEHGEITYEKVKSLFRNTDRPALGTRDVADEFGITPQAALYRLNRLRERDEVERYKIQSNCVIWWLQES